MIGYLHKEMYYELIILPIKSITNKIELKIFPKYRYII